MSTDNVQLASQNQVPPPGSPGAQPFPQGLPPTPFGTLQGGLNEAINQVTTNSIWASLNMASPEQALAAKTRFDVMHLTGSLSLGDGDFSRNENLLRNTVANLSTSNVTESEANSVARAVGAAFADGDISDAELDHISSLVSAANAGEASPPPTVSNQTSTPTSSSSWTFTNNGNGTGTIDLGRYSVSLNESNYEWTVTDKTTGQQTRVWGDPHVDFQNDGDTDLDFKANLSLMLEDGTKITCETLPFGNGQTVSTRLVITNKEQAIEVTGLAAGMDAAMNIRKIDDAAGAWDTSWGKTIVYQGDDGSWYAASGLLQQGAIRDDGSLNLDKVDKSKRLEVDTKNLFNGYYITPFSLSSNAIMENDEEEVGSMVQGFNDNYAEYYGNDATRATAVRNLLTSMGG